MKKIYLLLLAAIFGTQLMAQNFCDTTANIIIYSNYDGGTLNIDVDQNIPNLKIGVTSYENVHINISGTYSANVTEVRYAGYNGTNNHCGFANGTTITGAQPGTDTIILYPSAGYSNSNGYSMIICNYSCDNTTNQGGCNTPDQLVYYYTHAFNGTLRYHYTQYGCWSATPYAVSAGGNCCIMPVTTGIAAAPAKKLSVYPSPASDKINVAINGVAEDFALLDVLGNKIAQGKGSLETTSLPDGVYFVQVKANAGLLTKKIVVQH